MKKVEVLIIGAGPAGSVCANLLLKAGVDCLLIDHCTFPRDKICGGGLTSKTWHLLERLIPGVPYEYNPVSHIRLNVDNQARCEFDIDEPIRIVQRKYFDHALLKHYQDHGGEFIQGAPDKIEERDGQIFVTLKDGMQIACHYLVGADGTNSFVRRYLKPDTDRGILAMEQYVEKSGDNSIDVTLSQSYCIGGYFYRFPNKDFDVVGFGDAATTPAKFRKVMNDNGVPEGKARGAFIYLSNDYPLHDHIILIGDAGGFANRSTCEGLYDAMRTAENAAIAITQNIPFRQVNAGIFRKMRKEMWVTKVFFSGFGFAIVKWLCHHPGTIKWIFDTKMRREAGLKKKDDSAR